MPEKEVVQDAEEIEKQVTMVAYATEEHKNLSPEEWFGIVTDTDFEETETIEKTNATVTVEGPEGEYGYSTSWEKSIPHWKSIIDDLESDEVELSNGGKVIINKETETKEQQVNTVSDAIDTLLVSMFEELPDSIQPDIQLNSDWKRYERDEDIAVCTNHEDVEEMRVLSKEQKRKNDEMYETMGSWPCLSFRVDMTAQSDEEMERFTNDVISNLHKLLSKTDHIGKVRYMSCEVTTKKDGECYNL